MLRVSILQKEKVMNRQLDIALVLFALTIFCGIAAWGQLEDAGTAINKTIELSVDENADQATRDYYDDLASRETYKFLGLLIGTAVLGIATLTLGFRGTKQYFKDKRQVKYDIEERRHQELLEATRLAHRQTQAQEKFEARQPSLLYTANAHPLTPQPPTIDQILSEAQRVYKEGNLDLAIFILETTDDPRAQKVLAKLRGMKK